MRHIAASATSALAAGLLVAACADAGPATAPTLATTAVVVVDSFGRAATLDERWYTARPAYVVEDGQVGTRAGQDGTTLAIWQANAFPPDQFAEVVVGDLGGGSFADFRGLQVFVRLQSPHTGDRVGFHYNSGARRYEIKYEASPGRVLAQSGERPPPRVGDTMRLHAVGDGYTGWVNGQEILRTTGPLLADGRHVGFAIGIDPGSGQAPRHVVDAWRAGGR